MLARVAHALPSVLPRTASRAFSSVGPELMAQEDKYGAHNYHPLPVVLSRGEGVHVWDVDGKQYYDFLSAYSAVNHGHCHPRLVDVMVEQAKKLTLTSRAFHNDQLGPYCEYITNYFGYDRVLPMNTGVEAVETALKLVRKWGYEVRGVPENEAVVLFAKDNFHGRSIAAISASNDPDARSNFGPFVPNIYGVEYNSVEAMEAAFEKYPNVVGVVLEPIQGEAGVVVPDDSYLQAVHKLCKKNNALFVADEVQTGLCRTGKMLAIDYPGIKPDIVILGKALSGGMLPVSAVLASDEIILTIKPGQHGSTYGGNPLACAVAVEALQIMKDDNYAEHASKMGELLRSELTSLQSSVPQLTTVRGRGLLNAIVIEPTEKRDAWDVCVDMAKHGVLAKPTHGDIIRLAPPLVINEQQLSECVDVISKVLKQ